MTVSILSQLSKFSLKPSFAKGNGPPGNKMGKTTKFICRQGGEEERENNKRGLNRKSKAGFYQFIIHLQITESQLYFSG